MSDVARKILMLEGKVGALEAELADTKLMLSTHLEAGSVLRCRVVELELEVEKWKGAYDDAHAALTAFDGDCVK